MRGPAAMQAIGGTGEKIEKKEKTIFLEQVECCWVERSVVVQLYPWFKRYFPFFGGEGGAGGGG